MKSLSFENSILLITLVLVVLGLLAPLILVGIASDTPNPRGATRPAELFVGIGVIIRATARRLARSGARSVVRTTISTLTRTVARTLTRRALRLFIRSWIGSTGKQLFEDPRAGATLAADPAAVPRTAAASLAALLLGTLALCLSFWGILQVAETTGSMGILQSHHLNALSASLLAGMPMLCYAVLIFLAARWLVVPFRLVTTFEGVLVQAYFTGAGSFLPMTTDVELEGPAAKKAHVAFAALAGLYGLHLLTMILALRMASPQMNFFSGLLLVYCLVYAFPIKPLEGHTIWSHRKVLWFIIFVPIVSSFALSLPESLQNLL